jgi:hypothetical protein
MVSEKKTTKSVLLSIPRVNQAYRLTLTEVSEDNITRICAYAHL